MPNNTGPTEYVRLRLFIKAHRLAAMLVAWMVTNFLVYRLGLGWKKPCSCLGNSTWM